MLWIPKSVELTLNFIVGCSIDSSEVKYSTCYLDFRPTVSVSIPVCVYIVVKNFTFERLLLAD